MRPSLRPLLTVLGLIGLGAAPLLAAPVNDAFANPTVVNGSPFSVAATNVDATIEPGEPTDFGNVGASVWFEWTAPEADSFVVDTEGSDFDTYLAVWTGNDLASLVLIAANDDGGSGLLSRIEFAAEAGQTFRIGVYGYSGAEGAITLNLEGSPPPPVPPANDDFADGILLSGLSFSETGENLGATLEVGEPDPFPGFGFSEASVWYRWVAPVSGAFVSDTGGSDFDTVLAVWRGSDLATLDPVAANDQGLGLGNASRLVFEAVQGETYQFAVYGYFGSRGNFSLNLAEAVTGSITGQLFLPGGTEPAAGISVGVYLWVENFDEDGYWFWLERLEQTDANGLYAFDALEPGLYAFEFYDETDVYPLMFTGRSLTLDAVSGITLAEANLSVVAGDETLIAPGSISGRAVADEDGLPIENIYVGIFVWVEETVPGQGNYWQFLEEVSGQPVTDANGEFEFSGLAPGLYRLSFNDEVPGRYASEFYENSPGGTGLLLAEGENLVGVEASLGLVSSIRGALLPPEGSGVTPEFNVTLYVYDGASDTWTFFDSRYLGSEISFAFDSLPSGLYRMQFDDFSTGSTIYYGNVDSFEASPAIGLGSDFDQDLGSIFYGLAGSISGRITDAITGAPIEGATVRLDRLLDAGSDWEIGFAEATTAPDGSYTFAFIGGDSDYRLFFSGPAGSGYLDGYFNDIYELGYPVPTQWSEISVAFEQTVSGVDASMSFPASISGTVYASDGLTPLPGIEVEASPSFGIGSSVATSGVDGRYEIAGLYPVAHTLGFFDNLNERYATKYFGDTDDSFAAPKIVVAPGQSVIALDISLGERSSISGRVTDAAGDPVPGFTVSYFRLESNNDFWWFTSWATDSEGYYEIPDLLEGTYVLYMGGLSSGGSAAAWPTEFLGGGQDIASAQRLELGPGAHVSGVDYEVKPFGRIVGRVTGPDGTTGLAGAIVKFLLRDSSAEGSSLVGFFDFGGVFTDSTGAFESPPLAPGTYEVFSRGIGHTAIFAGGAVLGGGVPVEVTAGAVAVADASLEPEAVLSGSLFEIDGGAPASGVEVMLYAYNSETAAWEHVWTLGSYTLGSGTSSEGLYRVYGLKAGTYRIRFRDLGAYEDRPFYENLVYPGVSRVEDGVDVVVSAGASVALADVFLTRSSGMAAPRMKGKVVESGDGREFVANFSWFARWERDYRFRAVDTLEGSSVWPVVSPRLSGLSEELMFQVRKNLDSAGSAFFQMEVLADFDGDD